MPRLGPIPNHTAGNSETQPTPSGKEAGKSRLDEQKLKKACGDFESIFIAKMLKTMRGSVPPSGLFGKESGQEMFQSLFDEEIGKNLAKERGIGLGNMMFRNMTRKENHQTSPLGRSPGDLHPLQGRRKKEE